MSHTALGSTRHRHYDSPMKTSLDHLPEQKQQELQRAVDIIRDEISPDMLILFGSYARGDWVEDLDPDTLQYRYQSDFDLLVITENQRQADRIEQNDRLLKRLNQNPSRTPVSLIAEDIQFFNKRLRKSQYFYIDIQREGILLHDSGKFQLDEPREITLQERRKLAEEDYDFWASKANRLWEFYKFGISQGSYNEAVFQLHQVTESLYGTILLVFTRYKPSTHDLEKLGSRVAGVEPKFLEVFPKASAEEQERFKLLRKAYVDARYKPSYTISAEQLDWLAGRVKYLQELTEKLCKEKIDSFQ